MKCPKCGNNVADGSAFCNHCGNKLSAEILCPACNQSIPANSEFCPSCGKKVNTPAASDGRPTAQRQHEEWKRRNTRNNDEIVAVDPADNGKSNFNRNLIIGIAAIVAVIGLLMAMRGCNSNESKEEKNVPEETSTVQMTPDGRDPVAVFNEELARNNFMGDEAKTAMAIAVPEHDGKPATILGVTFLSNPSTRSFYKIYQLTYEGTTWKTEMMHQQFVNGRSLDFSNTSLMVEDNVVPRAVTINNNGKDYFYFAYVNMPSGYHVGGSGRVTLALYDLTEKKLTTLDYDGIIKVGQDGRQYIDGRPLNSVSSIEAKFLVEEAKKLKVIGNPEAQDKQEEEKAEEKVEQPKDPNAAVAEDAGKQWNEDNKDAVAGAKEGEEAAVQRKSYDKPIFKMENKYKSINNADYTIFSDKDGAVFGFDKATRKYFVIYNPGGPSTPTDISFAGDNVVHMRTANGTLKYTLKSNKIKGDDGKDDANKAKETTPEAK